MKLVVARKEHTCTLCGRKIPPGTRYWSDYHPDHVDPLMTRKEHANCEEYSPRFTADPGQTNDGCGRHP